MKLYVDILAFKCPADADSNDTAMEYDCNCVEDNGCELGNKILYEKKTYFFAVDLLTSITNIANFEHQLLAAECNKSEVLVRMQSEFFLVSWKKEEHKRIHLTTQYCGCIKNYKKSLVAFCKKSL